MKSIDLTPLRVVEVLPDGFLDGCSSLEEVDLSPLVNLREVGCYFMSGCTSLKSIDLTPLRVVEVLPDGFLDGCSSLEVVDLRPLVNLKDVGPYFLNGRARIGYPRSLDTSNELNAACSSQRGGEELPSELTKGDGLLRRCTLL